MRALLRCSVLAALACLVVAPTPAQAAEGTIAEFPRENEGAESLTPAVVSAMSYWVNNQATCGAECNGTKEKPWPTIRQAAEKVTPDTNTFDFINIHGGKTYKEGPIQFRNGVAGKTPLVFVGGPLSDLPVVEGELKVESSNVYFVFLTVEKSGGPCLAVRKGGLISILIDYVTLRSCKSEPFANWFSSEVAKNNTTLASEEGQLKIRVDTKGMSKFLLGTEASEKECPGEPCKAWWENHVSRLRVYYPGGEAGEAAMWAQKNLPMPAVVYSDWAKEKYTGEPEELYSPLRKAKREAFIERRPAKLRAEGFPGDILDDVNWRCSERRWKQESANEPIGHTETCGDEESRIEPEAEEEAKLVEGTRTAVGSGGLLEMNSQWKDLWAVMEENKTAGSLCNNSETRKTWEHACRQAAKAIANTELVTHEFGVDVTSVKQFEENLEYVKDLHSKGVHVLYCEPEPPNDRTDEYTLATYFLTNDGFDYTETFGTSPTNFWKGFESDGKLLRSLGKQAAGGAEEEVEKGSGHYKRAFEHGIVYAVAPGASIWTVTLPGTYTSFQHGKIEKGHTLGLQPEEGAVFHE